MVAQECAGMYGLVLACAGIVLAYVGMFGNVQSCAGSFPYFEPIHTHPIAASPIGRDLWGPQAACPPVAESHRRQAARGTREFSPY